MNITVMNGACEDYEFDVAELADGTLAPEKARIVRLHLAGCTRCRRWRDEYAAIDARLARALPQPRLPADFEWKLAARLRERASTARADTRVAAEREYADLMTGLRDRLRSATLGGVAGAVAATGCALAAVIQGFSALAALHSRSSSSGEAPAAGWPSRISSSSTCR